MEEHHPLPRGHGPAGQRGLRWSEAIPRFAQSLDDFIDGFDPDEVLNLGLQPDLGAGRSNHAKEVRRPWEEERKDFLEQADALRSELDDYREHAQELEGELAAHRAQADALLQELAAYRTQSDSLLEELASHRAQSAALLEERNAFSAHAEALSAELSQHQEQALALSRERDASLDRTIEVMRDRDAWRERANNAEERIMRSLSGRVKRRLRALVPGARAEGDPR